MEWIFCIEKLWPEARAEMNYASNAKTSRCADMS